MKSSWWESRTPSGITEIVPDIQPTIVQYNQLNGWIHSDWESPLGILKSSTDVQSGGFGRNIDNCTGVNPQETHRHYHPRYEHNEELTLKGYAGFNQLEQFDE